MIYQKLDILGAPLTVYAPDNSPEIEPNRLHPAVLLCPGGGYRYTSDREAEPVALQLLAAGICVFLLRYSCAPARYPTALKEAAAAMDLIRKQADAYHVDPERVAVMGYSAGAHLACSLSVRWKEPWLAQALNTTAQALRPDGMVLCYPVISSGPFRHEGSFVALTGSERPEDWVPHSLEDLVAADTPRAFLWHTFNDTSVPVENSIALFSALRSHGVSTELHIYPDGPHGLSLANELTAAPAALMLHNPDVSGWIDQAIRWIKKL